MPGTKLVVMETSDMVHKFALVVGDWSDDGHCEKFIDEIVCTHTLEEVKLAFRKGVEVLGFNIMDYCTEYEDNCLPEECLLMLKQHGFSLDDGYDNESVTPEEFVNIIMLTASFGLPELYWSRASKSSVWNVGGYGLFV